MLLLDLKKSLCHVAANKCNGAYKPVPSLFDFCQINIKLSNDFFLIQFNVPFKIISLIETSQSIGGAKREYPGKTT